MKKFFISDCHFGHKNIIKYENRPFDNTEKMDRYMIEKWNNKVSEDDEVYIIGDFSFYNKTKTISILDRLNGKKFLVRGNHDSKIIEYNYKNKFIWVKDYAEIKVDGKDVVLCHYPFMVWNGSNYGSINIYGHVHSMKNTNHPMRKPNENQYNAGADITNFEPVTLEELEIINAKWIKSLWGNPWE